MYIALYRKWRPADFDNIIGQDHIVTALKNQIIRGQVGHAYLFSGPRGTGKTSTAKVFARAMNCLSPVNGEPCGTCEACRYLADENNLDVIEIDAASNNGVDEIRDLREKVKFPPAACRYKVYIIDEVHMLSSGAFNALLKTLEEPPAHAVFILATTEQHKLPATILSRCQRYDFHRITTREIADRLRMILKESGADMTEDALMLIARSAEGGMRDALSMADMCISYGASGTIGYDDVAQLIGSADRQTLRELVEAILGMDTAGALTRIDRLALAGRDMTVLTRDLIEYFRTLMILASCPQPEGMIEDSPEALEAYRAQAQGVSPDTLLMCASELAQAEYQMKWSQRTRTLLEMAVVKICSPARAADVTELAQRLERLEERVTALAAQPPTQAAQAPTAPVPAPEAAAKAPQAEPQEAKAPEATSPQSAPPKPPAAAEPAPQPAQREAEAPADERTAAQLWKEIKASVKKKNSILYMMIQDAGEAKIADGKLQIRFPAKMKNNYEIAVKPDRLECIKQAAREIGCPYPVQLSCADEAQDDPLGLAQDLFGDDQIFMK